MHCAIIMILPVRPENPPRTARITGKYPVPKRFNLEEETLEERLEQMMEDELFSEIAKEYHRLLDILSNVDGDEIIALVIMAGTNVALERKAKRKEKKNH